jgi:hypothetical protein
MHAPIPRTRPVIVESGTFGFLQSNVFQCSGCGRLLIRVRCMPARPETMPEPKQSGHSSRIVTNHSSEFMVDGDIISIQITFGCRLITMLLIIPDHFRQMMIQLCQRPSSVHRWVESGGDLRHWLLPTTDYCIVDDHEHHDGSRRTGGSCFCRICVLREEYELACRSFSLTPSGTGNNHKSN